MEFKQFSLKVMQKWICCVEELKYQKNCGRFYLKPATSLDGVLHMYQNPLIITQKTFWQSLSLDLSVLTVGIFPMSFFWCNSWQHLFFLEFSIEQIHD